MRFSEAELWVDATDARCYGDDKFASAARTPTASSGEEEIKDDGEMYI
jgi:hypothetical protein